uniref:Branched-chain amino acid ABC transporter permease n=1 Tax=Fundidesulfovibrio putealis TaxID=270496 RepID=A0A7C4AGE5_9BACT
MLITSSIITGISMGAMYGLLALGYHITWSVSNTVNFSQGSSMMAGAVLGYTFAVVLGWPMFLAVPMAIALCGVLGLGVELFLVRPFVRKGSNGWLMATVAGGIVLDNLTLFTFGKEPRSFPSALAVEPIQIFGAGVYPLQLLIPAVGFAAALLIGLASRRTMLGRVTLAVAQRPEAARIMGIDTGKVIAGSFALSGMFAGLAGILIAPLFNVSAGMGVLFGIKAFAAAILGGITSAWGVMLAGLAYGLIESLTTALLGSTYTQIVSFSVIIAMLVVMPNGLLGRAAVNKV